MLMHAWWLRARWPADRGSSLASLSLLTFIKYHSVPVKSRTVDLGVPPAKDHREVDRVAVLNTDRHWPVLNHVIAEVVRFLLTHVALGH